ncbi:MAG: transposase [Actinobacteria bacterium]|nr:transposase [Actinomycetota bacterium]MCA1697811.1 transposase [Actinomycetota bacterium]
MFLVLELEVWPVRVTGAFCRLLRLDGVWVCGVEFAADRVVVRVALRRKRLVCPLCDFSTGAREGVQDDESSWRHLDLGVWRLEVRATLRQLRCPEHGVHVEAVPFARHRARCTRDFDDLVAWLATKADKTTITRLVRIDWQTIGRIIERVGDEHLDRADRLAELFEISIDEVAWRKGHRYLTLVGDHRRRCVVWGCEGKGQAAADRFFAELDPGGPVEQAGRGQTAEPLQIQAEAAAASDAEPVIGERAGKLTAVSMDMTGGYAKSVREHAPQAVICIDNYHVVQLATKALDEIRREHWNQLRQAGDSNAAKQFKNDRWSLLKNPEDLTEAQAATLAALQAAGGKVPRAWALKEMVRAIFAPGLTVDAVAALIDRLLARLSRSRLKPFVRLGRTIRKHRDGILAARALKLSNARAEALNNKVKLIVRRAYGFHSARAALALIHLSCGPFTLTIPHEKSL